MTALAVVAPDTDYGTDVVATTDTAPVWGLATGQINLAYALIRRLGCPRGALFYDPDYGTDLRIYVNRRVNGAATNRLPADISAECDKDERVQSTTATVSFNTQTRTMTIAIMVEPIVGQAFTLIIAATAVNISLLAINGIAVSAAAPTVPSSTVFLQGPPGADGATGAQGPAGSSGAGGTPQVFLDFDDNEGQDSTGTEQVIAQKYVHFDPLPGTITVELGGLIYSTAGTGTFNFRIGGTPGAADGTIRATLTTTSNTPVTATAVVTGIANPTGWQLVKLTAKASGAGQTAGINNMTASFR